VKKPPAVAGDFGAGAKTVPRELLARFRDRGGGKVEILITHEEETGH
jgi:hypothetical protein